MLEIPRKPIRISFKIFEGKHAKDVEKEEVKEAISTWTSPTPIIEGVATGPPTDNIELFHFLSSNLMQVRRCRKEIVKEKKKPRTKKKLSIKELNIQQLFAILFSQVAAPSKAPSFRRQNSF